MRLCTACIATPPKLFLAGGLTPENVGQAIEEVGPFGLDVCSGVRTDGKLDAAKLKRFFAAVRSAGAQCADTQ